MNKRCKDRMLNVNLQIFRGKFSLCGCILWYNFTEWKKLLATKFFSS